MALMPEDLMNQRFTPVRFSEGYDMDEVDNFLDHEVEPRLKELIAENERLKTELEEAHNRIAELEAGAPAASPVAADTTGEGEAVIDGVPTSPAEQSEVETTGPQAVVADAPAEEPADGPPDAVTVRLVDILLEAHSLAALDEDADTRALLETALLRVGQRLARRAGPRAAGLVLQ